jgi:hypothetical protein
MIRMFRLKMYGYHLKLNQFTSKTRTLRLNIKASRSLYIYSNMRLKLESHIMWPSKTRITYYVAV